jgi:hypothetical protein
MLVFLKSRLIMKERRGEEQSVCGGLAYTHGGCCESGGRKVDITTFFWMV